MSPESEQLISEATAGLQLLDVVLHESRLFRGELMQAESDGLDALQQHKRGVRFDLHEHAGTESRRALRVLVSLGTRVVDQDSGADPRVFFGVEADYLAVYLMVRPVTQDALKAFAEFNAVHNVWPFWRQHVFDLLGQARLPMLQIPLFSGDGQ